HSYRLGGELHYACPCLVLRRHPRDRRCSRANPPTALSRRRAGALRLDFWGTSYPCAAVERRHSPLWRIPRHESQTRGSNRIRRKPIGLFSASLRNEDVASIRFAGIK